MGYSERLDLISSIHIYMEPGCASLDFDEVAEYVAGLLPAAEIMLRDSLLDSWIDDDGLRVLATRLAMAKVRDLNRQLPAERPPLTGEITYEKRRLDDGRNQVYGLLYDAFAFSDICLDLLPPGKTCLEQLNIVFTNQLIGTWEIADRRYHARTIICGSPSIISISGLVEAPAKSPAYYLARRSAEAFGLAEESKVELASSFADDCLGPEDGRLTEVAKGYVMQAIVYRITGEAFCEDPGCRLYNAHWQRELLEAQFGGDYEYCRKHSQMFRRLAKDGKA